MAGCPTLISALHRQEAHLGASPPRLPIPMSDPMKDTGRVTTWISRPGLLSCCESEDKRVEELGEVLRPSGDESLAR